MITTFCHHVNTASGVIIHVKHSLYLHPKILLAHTPARNKCTCCYWTSVKRLIKFLTIAYCSSWIIMVVLHPNFRTELKIREFAYSKRILPNPNFVARFGRIRRFGRFMNYSIQMLKIRHYFTGTLQYCHARKYQIQSMHLTLDSCMPAWKPRLFIIINCKSNVDPRSRRCVAFKIQLSHWKKHSHTAHTHTVLRALSLLFTFIIAEVNCQFNDRKQCTNVNMIWLLRALIRKIKSPVFYSGQLYNHQIDDATKSSIANAVRKKRRF